MNYFLLFVAISLNVVANYFMKKSHIVDSGNVIVLLYAIVALGLSFVCYVLTLKTLPVSIAYVFLTGGSLVGITIISVLFFNNNVSLNLILGIVLVILGIVLVSQEI